MGAEGVCKCLTQEQLGGECSAGHWAGLPAVATAHACGMQPRGEIRNSFLHQTAALACAVPPSSEPNTWGSQGTLAGVERHRGQEKLPWARVFVGHIKFVVQTQMHRNATLFSLYH